MPTSAAVACPRGFRAGTKSAFDTADGCANQKSSNVNQDNLWYKVSRSSSHCRCMCREHQCIGRWCIQQDRLLKKIRSTTRLRPTLVAQNPRPTRIACAYSWSSVAGAHSASFCADGWENKQLTRRRALPTSQRPVAPDVHPELQMHVPGAFRQVPWSQPTRQTADE